MKTTFTILIGIIFFMVAFGTALWFFMPWREVGKAVLSVGATRLEKQGVRLSFSGVETADGGFTVKDLSLGGILALSCQSVTIRPQFLMSVMNLAPACEVEFNGGSATMGQQMNFGSGGFLLTASPHEVLLERLWTDGDFALRGFLSVDLDKMRLGRSEAALKIPASFDP